MITDSILVVLSNPVAGRLDDFDDWYSNIHIRDAMRFRGALCAQRFAPLKVEPNDPKPVHLALYETSEAARFTQEHIDNAGTPRMRTTSAFDRTRISDYYYRPLSYWRRGAGARSDGAVVLEQFRCGAGQEETLLSWLQGPRAGELRDVANVQSHTVAVFNRDHQMLGTPAPFNVVAISRVADVGLAAKSWPRVPDSVLGTWASDAHTSFWRPITGLLTADDVMHPTSESLAAEESARRRMGRDYLPPNPALSA
jgi:hypothetical protein